MLKYHQSHLALDILAIACVLIGLLFVALSIGPFENLDTAWEYKAAEGVVKWGMPFVEVQGSMINQPPIGFYFQGLFMTLMGNSIENGAFLVTLFGIASALMIYLIGRQLFDKSTAIVATVLFGLSMWELVLSRSFLIDTQCLFWSLCCLCLGIFGINRNSNKLIIVSGIFFALSFYTKLFAVFILIPLALYYWYKQENKVPKLPVKLIGFFAPLAIASVVWYIVDFFMMPSYLPKGLGYLFFHSDFADLNPAGVNPSFWAIPRFLTNYGLGPFFVISCIFSVLLGLIFRKQLGKKLVTVDLIFALSIVVILAVNLGLVIFNLKVPYTSIVKYSYQSLPLFCLLAGSLVTKSIILLRSSPIGQRMKLIYRSAALIGILSILLSFLYSVYFANQLSITRFIVCSVEDGKLLGYYFDNPHALTQVSPLFLFQYLGFGLILLGLLLQFRANFVSKKIDSESL